MCIRDRLKEVDGASSEYQVMIDHLNGKDIMTLFFETEAGVDKARIANNVQAYFKMRIGITIVPKPVAIGELPQMCIRDRSSAVLTLSFTVASDRSICSW